MKLQLLLFMMLLASIHIAETEQNNVIVLEYIYFRHCQSCPSYLYRDERMDSLLYKIKKEYGDKVRIEWIDATIPKGAKVLKKYNITESHSIVINGEYLISGDQITWRNIKQILDSYLTGSALPRIYGGNPRFNGAPHSHIWAY